MKEISGKLIKLDDNVSSEQILPPQYAGTGSAKEMAKHILENYRNEQSMKIAGGELLVAGSRFGCGAVGAQAAAALKAAGVSGVIAKSFGRAFFRSAINHGLPAVTADIVENVNDGDQVTLNLAQGSIVHNENEVGFAPYPEFVLNIIKSNGLTAAVKKELKKS